MPPKATKKPDLSNIASRIETIMELMSMPNISIDIQSNLDDIINQLKCVQYIQYPISMSTVDVIALDPETEYVLLGRKPGQTQYQFPGGFRDPKEINTQAGAREFFEEAGSEIGLLNHERFIYLKSLFIDDRRYKDSCHKITTDIVSVHLTPEETEAVSAGDDLEEVRWFKINDLIESKKTLIRDIHLPIFDIFLEKIWEITK